MSMRTLRGGSLAYMPHSESFLYSGEEGEGCQRSISSKQAVMQYVWDRVMGGGQNFFLGGFLVHG